MKKISVLLLATVLFSCVLAGCATKSANSSKTSSVNTEQSTSVAKQTEATASAESSDETINEAIKDIKAKGKLVLATSADYPPYEWHMLKDGKDEIVGFDIAIARALAKSIGVELEIKDLDFEAIIPSVSSGQADIGIAGLSTTPERLEAVNMTDSYFQNKQVVLVPKTAKDNYKSMADFKGKTVGAQTGSIAESTVRESFPKDVQVKSLAKLNNLVMEVQNGTADALVIAKSSGEQYVKQFSDLVALELDIPDEPGVCIALKKGNDALTTYINQELKKLITDGKVEQWIKQYEALSNENSQKEN